MSAKRIHFIRHAQSEHNARAADAPDEDVVRRDPALRDAPLTVLGHGQAKTLAEDVAALRDIELVVVSPLTRAIQTTLAAFEHHPAPRLIEALHREKQESFCDIGRSPQLLAAEFATFCFDHLEDPWWFDGPLDGASYPRERWTPSRRASPALPIGSRPGPRVALRSLATALFSTT